VNVQALSGLQLTCFQSLMYTLFKVLPESTYGVRPFKCSVIDPRDGVYVKRRSDEPKHPHERLKKRILALCMHARKHNHSSSLRCPRLRQPRPKGGNEFVRHRVPAYEGN
jgi:hypothetical protein